MSREYISIAVLAYSIFDGLGKEYISGKQLYDAYMFYSHRLIKDDNPLFRPQMEALDKYLSAKLIVRRDTTADRMLFKLERDIGHLLDYTNHLICGNFALFIAKDPPNSHRSDYGYEDVRLNDAILSLNKIWL